MKAKVYHIAIEPVERVIKPTSATKYFDTEPPDAGAARQAESRHKAAARKKERLEWVKSSVSTSGPPIAVSP